MSDAATASASGSHPAPAREEVSLAALWIGIAGGPTAWALQLTLGFALAAYGCYPKGEPLAQPVWSNLWTVVLWISIAAAAASVVAAALSLHSWSRTRREKPGAAGRAISSGDGRTRFLALCGLLTSLLFLVAVGFESMSLFLSPVCRG